MQQLTFVLIFGRVQFLRPFSTAADGRPADASDSVKSEETVQNAAPGAEKLEVSAAEKALIEEKSKLQEDLKELKVIFKPENMCGCV